MNEKIMESTTNASPSWSRTEQGVIGTLRNGVHLEFAVENGLLQGLQQATIAGLPLIAPGSLRLPHVETRDGWTLSGYRLTGLTEEGDTLILEAAALGSVPDLGRRLDMFQFPYVRTPRRTPEGIGTFRWHLTPETVSFGHPNVRQNAYSGFSYRYEFHLTHPFHWVLDSGTWEAGGDPEGITLLSLHMAAIGGPMEQTLSRQGKGYTSAETFEKGSSNNADVFHDYANDPNDEYILPIQAQLRGAGGALFDTQYGAEGLLFCYYAEADYYRTLVEWQPKNIGIGHLDQHFFPKTQDYLTPAKYILAAATPGLTRIDALNFWTDAYDSISLLWQKQAGLPRVEPEPGFGLDTCGGAGEHIGYPPADLFDRWEARLPWMQEMGYKTFYVTGFGNHAGHDLPFVSNMCTPFDYHVHARYGGPERFREFCAAAHARGIKIATWIGVPAQSAPIIRQHPEWMIRYDNGAPWDGNYSNLVAASLRLGFHDWLLDELRYLKDLGLDCVFFDSYHNLWAMPINYTDPQLVPQFKDLMAFQSDCEKIGLTTWVESFSPFGLTAAGFWRQYGETPELSYVTHYRGLADDTRSNDFTNGVLSPSIYFRMLANKAPIGMSVMELDNAPFQGEVNMPPEIGPMNHAYNALLPAMQVRTLLADGSVEWYAPETGRRALFGGGGSVTVPPGFRAEPVYGTDQILGAGIHAVGESTGFHLVPA
ncbi:MAG: hypothetical protein ACRYFS_10960 [Janthinobacterium lividum]